MSERLPGDGELIAASIANAELFAGVFERHGSAVHRYLARRLGGDLADDLTAEVFVGAFRHRAKYKAATPSALPWLFGIAANVAAQHRRDEARRWRLLAALPAGLEATSETEDADDRVVAESFRPALVEALLSLPAIERQVLLLVAWEQLNSTEVAEVLAISAATARTRLHRARVKVRSRLIDATPHAEAESASLEEFLRYE
jgi:RNA polymerase sigma factor (sigma-70 family)